MENEKIQKGDFAGHCPIYVKALRRRKLIFRPHISIARLDSLILHIYTDVLISVY